MRLLRKLYLVPGKQIALTRTARRRRHRRCGRRNCRQCTTAATIPQRPASSASRHARLLNISANAVQRYVVVVVITIVVLIARLRLVRRHANRLIPFVGQIGHLALAVVQLLRRKAARKERRQKPSVQPRKTAQPCRRECTATADAAAALVLFGQLGQMFRIDGMAPFACLRQRYRLTLTLLAAADRCGVGGGRCAAADAVRIEDAAVNGRPARLAFGLNENRMAK